MRRPGWLFRHPGPALRCLAPPDGVEGHAELDHVPPFQAVFLDDPTMAARSAVLTHRANSSYHFSSNPLRAGWPWRLPARAPTDPDVRALTHPVLQPTAWPSRKGPRGCPSTLRGQAAGPRGDPPVSLARGCRPALRFPPQGPPGRVPLLQRYYQSATTSCRPSRRASLPSLGGTPASTRSVRSPADECAAGAWSW